MTIRSVHKNISAEKGDVVISVEQQGTLNKANDKSNFSNNLILKITQQDFIHEDNTPHSATITVPMSELVRIGYLTDKYYDKTYIDSTFNALEQDIEDNVKLHFEEVSEKPTVEYAKTKPNYIFIKAFDVSIDNTELYQEGDYIEYIYNQAKNSVEEIGSTKIDLKPYLKKADLNAKLLECSNFTEVKTQSNTNKNNITSLQNNKLDKQQQTNNGILTTNDSGLIQVSSNISRTKINDFAHTHGNINNNGTINGITNSFLKTNDSGVITGVANISDSIVKVTSSVSNLGLTGNNILQSQVNTAINNKIGTLINNSDTYELKSDLRNDVWGTSGFRALQDNEDNNSSSKNLKLGDYIYQHLYANFYTKSEINDKIQNITNLQNQILGIL